MKKSHVWGLVLGVFFLFSHTGAAAEGLNTLVVVRDAHHIRSLYFDGPAQYSEEGLPLYDTSRRVRDLNIAAFRFTRDGKRFFVPLETASREFAQVELLGLPGPSHDNLSLRITPRKGEAFEVERATLVRHVGDEYPAHEIEIEKFMAHEDAWRRDFLPMAAVREIHFVSREKKKEALTEERVLVGPALSGDGHSVEALTGLLLAMAKTGGQAGRLSFDIRFDVNSANLTPASRVVLDRLSAALKDPRLGGTRFRLGGHADSTGQAAHNLALSRRRAESVRTYLVQQGGIEAFRLEATGYGDTRPVASNRTPEGRKANRRVEVEFLSPG
jgi:outer membrane protein OmpA-like peptidoglycan-associated protein